MTAKQSISQKLAEYQIFLACNTRMSLSLLTTVNDHYLFTILIPFIISHLPLTICVYVSIFVLFLQAYIQMRWIVTYKSL